MHPELKPIVRAALDLISANPECGRRLRGELQMYLTYRVKRFRIVYGLDRSERRVRIVAIDHRYIVYEALAARLKKGNS